MLIAFSLKYKFVENMQLMAFCYRSAGWQDFQQLRYNDGFLELKKIIYKITT